jgi:hypothetical protein
MGPSSSPPPAAARSLAILYPGSCEPLKAFIHGMALSLAAVMGAYNAAAWLRRRQRHLAVNAVIYLAAVVWEQRHVAQHRVFCPGAADRPPDEQPKAA